MGNFDNIFLKDVFDQPNSVNSNIPDMVFCIYQGMFAAITPGLIIFFNVEKLIVVYHSMHLALAIGAAAERARFLPSTVFIFLWTTLVYDVLACWTWNPNGWSLNMGGIIFEVEFNL